MRAKRFFTKLWRAGAIIAALVVAMQLNPHVAQVLTLGVALICGVALIRPFNWLGLGSRVFSGFMFVVVGFVMAPISLTKADEAWNAHLAQLKEADAVAYLEEIEHVDPDRWYRELKVLAPERYEEERQRRARIKAEEEKARQKERAERRAAQCGEGNATNAYFYTQAFVEQRLKSPSTADFPSIHTRNAVSAYPIGGCVFEVSGYVDAQNGFGATLRTYFLAKIKRLPEQDSWRLIDLQFLTN
ncbi:hypothetical protein [Roseovarius pacificus]|uniref:hypothetical protein n=1 Tax=Roseovarius pacificus TaxID=337701 RepID=UPI002A18912D|nr:hypothetical protein [Roseovarius pacificus]